MISFTLTTPRGRMLTPITVTAPHGTGEIAGRILKTMAMISRVPCPLYFSLANPLRHRKGHQAYIQGRLLLRQG